MFLRLCIVGVVLGSCFLSSAQNYKRGSLLCSGFEEAETSYRYYEFRDDGLNWGRKSVYGQCLIAAGRVKEGLWLWHEVLDHAPANEIIRTAFLYARYVKTGGTFKTLDYNALDDAIHAYGRVSFNINLSGNYPNNGNKEHELVWQTELSSAYNIPKLYMLRFGLGVIGYGNAHQFQSVSYISETYPDYSNSTWHSLDQAIKFGNQCANLPDKWHYASDSYEKAKFICRTIVNTALTLKPVEEKRLNAINRESCRRNLSGCKDFTEAMDDIETIYTSYLVKQ